MSDKVRENRLRRKADRMGLRLLKSRRRDPDSIDYGCYALVTIDGGGTIHPHGVTSLFRIPNLDEVEEWLEHWDRKR